MKAAVLVPGIMATRLRLNGEDIWPPKPTETIWGYNRLDALLSDDVEVGEPVDRVLCYAFYETIVQQLTALGFRAGDPHSRLVEFGYDWRLDIRETARALAARLQSLHDDGVREIHLVGHSMGGLVSRLAIEADDAHAQDWYGDIASFISLAVPHLGAPLAIARVMGLDGTLGISGPEFARLARDARYPSGYQLMPPPGEAAIWDLHSPDIQPVDPYHEATARRLGLSWTQVEKAKAVHAALARGPASGIRYTYFAGTGHSTVTRVNVALGQRDTVDPASCVLTTTADAGDGTVPMWSALPRLGQKQIVTNEHATVFEGAPFRKAFFRLLGGDQGAAVESVIESFDDASVAAHVATVRLTVDAPVYGPDQPVELVMSPAQTGNHPSGLDAVKGRLVLQGVSETARATDVVATHEIDYSGPPISRLAFMLKPPEPGLYILRFEGTPAASNFARLAVSAPQ